MVAGVRVLGNFFSVLGTPPALGRGFRFEETWDGEDRVVVISDGLWRRRFGAAPRVLGREISLDSVNRVVVGVMPPGFGCHLQDTVSEDSLHFTPT